MKTKRILLMLCSLLLVFALTGCDMLATLFGETSAQTEESTATSTTEAPPPAEPGVAELDPTALQVHYIDCGQADSILILAPTGESMLIDTGDNEDESRQAVIDYLTAKNIETLDWLVLTHPHADHIGGAKRVLTEIGAEKVLLPDKLHTTRLYADMLDAILDTNAAVVAVTEDAAKDTDLFAEGMEPTTIKPGESISLGAADVRVLGPVKYTYGSNLNDYSIFLRLTYGQNSFLFTGDAETDAEQDVLAKFGASALKCDVLKSGHHGSDTSSDIDLVRATGASIAVISVGEGNDYNHPCAVTLDKYTAAGMRIYRTDLLGTVVLQTTGEVLSVVGEAPVEPTTPSETSASSSDSATPSTPVTPQPAGTLTVHTISCGAGEAILLTSPDGKHMMIDTGTNNLASRTAVQAYLRELGVETLDYMVLTNNRENHIGGAALLLTTFPTEKVILTGKAHTTATYLNVIDAAIDKAGGIAVVGEDVGGSLAALGVTNAEVLAKGATFRLGAEVTVEILAPLTYGASAIKASIVLRVTYGETSFLFTGNIDGDDEADLMEAYPTGLASTVLKVANHGNTNATTAAFVAAVAPQFALISAKDAADAALLSRLEGITTYQTATDATIVLESDGTTVRYVAPAA